MNQKGDKELSQAEWESDIWEHTTALSVDRDPALTEVWSYPRDASYDRL